MKKKYKIKETTSTHTHENPSSTNVNTQRSVEKISMEYFFYFTGFFSFSFFTCNILEFSIEKINYWFVYCIQSYRLQV